MCSLFLTDPESVPIVFKRVVTSFLRLPQRRLPRRLQSHPKLVEMLEVVSKQKQDGQ